MLYDWLRALHIIFVIAWMAGLLMLPRLMVYQVEGEPGGELFSKMDEAIKRLRSIIINPAMILTWAFGIALIAVQWPAIMSFGWMHAKLALVLILSGYHGWLVGQSRKISNDECKLTSKQLRLANEVPFLIAVAAVIMVVVQPF